MEPFGETKSCLAENEREKGELSEQTSERKCRTLARFWLSWLASIGKQLFIRFERCALPAARGPSESLSVCLSVFFEESKWLGVNLKSATRATCGQVTRAERSRRTSASSRSLGRSVSLSGRPLAGQLRAGLMLCAAQVVVGDGAAAAAAAAPICFALLWGQICLADKLDHSCRRRAGRAEGHLFGRLEPARPDGRASLACAPLARFACQLSSSGNQFHADSGRARHDPLARSPASKLAKSSKRKRKRGGETTTTTINASVVRQVSAVVAQRRHKPKRQQHKRATSCQNKAIWALAHELPFPISAQAANLRRCGRRQSVGPARERRLSSGAASWARWPARQTCQTPAAL